MSGSSAGHQICDSHAKTSSCVVSEDARACRPSYDCHLLSSDGCLPFSVFGINAMLWSTIGFPARVIIPVTIFVATLVGHCVSFCDLLHTFHKQVTNVSPACFCHSTVENFNLIRSRSPRKMGRDTESPLVQKQ